MLFSRTEFLYSSSSLPAVSGGEIVLVFKHIALLIKKKKKASLVVNEKVDPLLKHSMFSERKT